MSIVEGIVTFAIIWWLVLFMVLPWGITREENPEIGHEAGAPVKTRLWLKIAITTGISLVLLVIAWAIAESGCISFRG